jgi:RNA polymerase sigma-70 factor (ECF subfamily)
MARVRERDLRAFESLYRRYHPRLFHYLVHLTRSPQLAEEVLNDTMLVVWSRPASFNGTSRLSGAAFRGRNVGGRRG